MSLISLVRVAIGQTGTKPGTIKMVTTDNIATITTSGYLNGVGNQLLSLNISPSDIIECLYSYNESTGAGIYTQLAVSISNGLITLSADSGNESLADGHIFVGNASGVAADVAMSGDATIVNTGALTIANSAITESKIQNNSISTVKIQNNSISTVKIQDQAVTTAEIADANVTLAKLASGIIPTAIVKNAGKWATAGGSSTIPITAAGVLASDMAFASVQSSANPVSVLSVTPSANTITIVLSADPGSNILAFSTLRIAS